MAKMKAGKKIGVALIIGLVLYLLYKMFAKGGGGGILTPKTCYPLEEVHETGANDGTTWVSIVKFDANNEETIRPPAGTYSIGQKIKIKNTTAGLDGSYPIVAIWTDASNNIGSFRVATPQGYNFNYTQTQGGGQNIDVDYFGVGEICV
tara:strand:- start:5091 stop:5537 length:447 start_codon:yes stop_codon:yes gene_type:complete